MVKGLVHSSIVWNCWREALAQLCLARANALQAKNLWHVDVHAARFRVLAAYDNFLTRWKDADPGIHIYRQAKAEYMKLP